MALAFARNRRSQLPAEDSPAFGAVAERFRRAGELERAVSLCQEGLRKFPEHLSARVTLGWALLDLGRHNEARTELERVMKRAPDNLAAIRGLAELHDRTENADVSDRNRPGSWLPNEAASEPDPEPVHVYVAPEPEPEPESEILALETALFANDPLPDLAPLVALTPSTELGTLDRVETMAFELEPVAELRIDAQAGTEPLTLEHVELAEPAMVAETPVAAIEAVPEFELQLEQFIRAVEQPVPIEVAPTVGDAPVEASALYVDDPELPALAFDVPSLESQAFESQTFESPAFDAPVSDSPVFEFRAAAIEDVADLVPSLEFDTPLYETPVFEFREAAVPEVEFFEAQSEFQLESPAHDVQVVLEPMSAFDSPQASVCELVDAMPLALERIQPQALNESATGLVLRQKEKAAQQPALAALERFLRRVESRKLGRFAERVAS